MRAGLALVRSRWTTFAWLVFAVFAMILQSFALTGKTSATSANITSAVLTPALTSINVNTPVQFQLEFQNSSQGSETLDSPASITLTTDSLGGSFADDTGVGGPWTANSATYQAAAASSKTFYYQDSSAGTHTITVVVVGGGLSMPLTAKATVTMTKIAITSPALNQAWLSGGSTINGTADVYDKQVQAQVVATTTDSAGNNNCTTNLVGSAYTATINSDGTWSLPLNTLQYSDGYYCIAANVVDGGVTYNAQPVFIHIDNTAPIIGGINNGGFTKSPQVPFTVQEANLASITVDGKAFTCTNTSSNNVWSCPSISGEGQHTVLAIDQAGNSATVKFTIDTTAPQLQIVATTPHSDGSYTVTGTTSDFLSGVASLTGSVDGESNPITFNADGTWSLTTPILAPAFLHTISIVSTDGAGNVAMIQTYIPAAITPSGDTSQLIPTQPLRIVATTIPVFPSLPSFSVTPRVTQKTTASSENDGSPIIQVSNDLKNNPSQSSNSAAKIFGLAWYWWLFVITAIGVVWRIAIIGINRV